MQLWILLERRDARLELRFHQPNKNTHCEITSSSRGMHSKT